MQSKMKSTDTISVLVCVHSPDHEHDMLLQRALESLVRQTYCEFETVVVLDECHEDTRALVDHYKDVLNLRVLERPRKQGLAAAKNYGITHCNGDWIAYLDADDQWMDCKLEIQRNWMITCSPPSADFCGVNAWDLLDGVLRPNCFAVTQYVTHAEIVAQLPRENVLCHGSMMIRRSALEALKGYRTDRSLLGREDYDLWQRAAAAGYRFLKVPERLYIYSLGTSVPR
jgi:teichuronic acid biosynthesis glycosyltransferase TuaG